VKEQLDTLTIWWHDSLRCSVWPRLCLWVTHTWWVGLALFHRWRC